MVNLKSSVFLFIGQDIYSKENAVKELSASVVDSSSKDLDCKVFHGADTDAKDIIDYVTTIPFFSSKRFAVIKNFEKLPQHARTSLVNYAKKPASSTILVLETGDDSILKEHGDLVGHAEVRVFDTPKGGNLALWVKKLLLQKGKTIEQDALSAVSHMQGYDLLSLAHELEKLTCFVGEKSVITLDDVEKAVGKSIIASAFDLTDAVERKDIDAAIRVVSDLMRAGKKHYEIVGLLCWHLKKVFRAKTLKLQGAGDSEIASILKIGRRYAGDFFRQLRDQDIVKIKTRLAVLLEADLDIKRAKYDPALILEFALIRLCLG